MTMTFCYSQIAAVNVIKLHKKLFYGKVEEIHLNREEIFNCTREKFHEISAHTKKSAQFLFQKKNFTYLPNTPIFQNFSSEIFGKRAQNSQFIFVF
jgi:hypothetical protein